MWDYLSRLEREQVLSSQGTAPTVPSQTLILIPPSSSSWSPKPNFFCSDWPSSVGNESEVHGISDSHGFKEPGDEKVEIFGGIEEENTPEIIDPNQLESVASILRSSSAYSIGLSLDKLLLLHLSLTEEFVARVIEASSDYARADCLIGFFKWVLQKEESSAAKNSSTAGLLVRSVRNNSARLTKMEAYALWDLVKELGKEKGLLNTEILNDLIAMFWKLEKGKAGLEVFGMFDEFGCYADGNTYYYTIEALGKRSLFDDGWGVCRKMLDSGNLPPDGSQIGRIVKFLCKGKKAKEAHLVYLMAEEKKISQLTSCLDPLVRGLAA